MLEWENWAADASGDPNLGLLAQYGILGLVAGGLIWFAKFMVGRETARADRLEAEVIRLNGLIVDRVIPALTSSAGAVEDATELLRAFQRERELSLFRERQGADRDRDRDHHHRGGNE